jgi:undecaprenyl-diphosphatase
MQRQNRVLIACIVFFAAFLLITFLRPSFNVIDTAVNQWMPTIQAPALTFLAEGIAFIFDTTSLVVISIAIASILFLKNHKPQGLLLLGAMGGEALLVTIIKNLDRVGRPTNALVSDSGFSYPSGHSVAVVVFGGVLAYFAWRHWHSTRSRTGVVVGLGVLVGVVGFDRIYLSVHWLSDVIGGWLFGAFWLSFVLLVFGWLEHAGKFKSERFGVVANWLFVAALIAAVLIVLVTLLYNHIL